ncbi:MAG: amino acid adenylation domain-containing protein [Ignavibacteriaceae bacterium]
MLDKIKESCEKFSDRNAFCINDVYYTYEQFAKIVSKIRHELENRCKNERLIAIATYESPGIETYASIYACWFAGCGFVPINPDNPVDRNLSILQQTEIKTILSCKIDDKVNKISRAADIKVVCTSKLAEAEINLNLPNISGEQIAYILFTSGSTGIPKGVPITINNLSSFIDAFYSLGYNIDENDRFLQMFELTFDFSVICYTAPLCKGASIYTVEAEGVKYASVYMALEKYEITFACMVPSILSYLRPYFEDINLEKLKYSLFCGETLLSEIAKEWNNCTPNGRIINAYGPTEATVFCLIYNFNGSNTNERNYNGGVPIGKPMKNMNAIVIDENLKPLPKGNIGELCLTGGQLMSGYWKNSEKNKEVFFNYPVNGNETIFYRTGDLAFIDNDDVFMFAGRIDSQIKIQGFRIELGEIEHFAREFTRITNVAAVPYKNKNNMIQIHLFVENFSGKTIDIAEYLKTKVPYYMVPAEITSLPSFPLNSNGKVDRKKLTEIAQSNV